MRTEVKNINPYLAKSLLSLNTKNRDLNQHRVNVLVEQMKAGLWKENGEPIIISDTNVLLNGQHRLHAVIEANYQYKCAVVYGVSDSSMETIDTGDKRSQSDVLKLNGIQYHVLAAAIVKSIMIFEHSNKRSEVIGSKSGLSKMSISSKAAAKTSNLAILQYVKENEEYIMEICRNVTDIKRFDLNNLHTPKELGFLSHLFSPFNPLDGRLNEFLKKLMGHNLNQSDGIFHLNKKLLKAKNEKMTMSSEFKLALTIKSWNAFVKGDNVKVLRWNKDSEVFPEPIKL